MLTERTEQRLDILPNGIIQVKDYIVIEKDGVVISRSKPLAKVLDVDVDISNESDRIKAIAPRIWTAAIKAARISERAAAQAVS